MLKVVIALAVTVVVWLILAFVFGFISYKIFEKPEKATVGSDDATEFGDVVIASYHFVVGAAVSLVLVVLAWVSIWYFF